MHPSASSIHFHSTGFVHSNGSTDVTKALPYMARHRQCLPTDLSRISHHSVCPIRLNTNPILANNHLIYLNLLVSPRVEVDRLHSADMDAKISMDSSATYTDKHSKVPRRPARSFVRHRETNGVGLATEVSVRRKCSPFAWQSAHILLPGSLRSSAKTCFCPS